MDKQDISIGQSMESSSPQKPGVQLAEYSSGDSFENHGLNNGVQDFYEGALKNTEGIYENQLGPSEEFVDSYSPPQMRYMDAKVKQIAVEMQETTAARERQDN